MSKAPLGYLNVRERDPQDREVRTVTVDPERAPLVAWVFEAYAAGNRSLSDLADEFAARGLTSPPTPKRPAKPIGVSTLQRMLRNPYYKGGETYPYWSTWSPSTTAPSSSHPKPPTRSPG